MNSNHYCVILAGGTGRNFWPMGREAMPLQFLSIAGTNESFLRATFNRYKKVFATENILITTLAKYKDLVKEQIPEIPNENIIVEPYGRHTAVCVTYANYCILKRNENAIVTITPSDLLVFDQDKFDLSLETVLSYSQDNDSLTIIGISPDHPDINYGYIQVKANPGEEFMQVKTFTEKPSSELAEIFISSGEFYWNSGIYTAKASVIREELETYASEISSLFSGWENALGSPYETDFVDKAYMNAAMSPFELAVLEKTQRAMVFPGNFGWADVGNWSSLYSSFPQKDQNGIASNTENILSHDSKNCLVISKDPSKLIAMHGLKDYMIIDTDTALLICPKEEMAFRDIMSELGMPKFEKYK